MNNILAFPKKIRLQNFADAWVMTDFPRKFFNTAFITVINLIFTLITNSFAAYAITRNRKKSKFFSVMYYYFISAMFIPFQVIMLPLVVQANTFHLDNIFGITFLYIIFGLSLIHILSFHGLLSWCWNFGFCGRRQCAGAHPETYVLPWTLCLTVHRLWRFQSF